MKSTQRLVRADLDATLVDDVGARLDDVLSRWHSWQHGARVTRGFKARAAVVGDFRNGNREEETYESSDDARSRQVDFEVGEMKDPWRTAIYFEARNIATGAAVWKSPRLPVELNERRQLVATARQLLVIRLRRAGVL